MKKTRFAFAGFRHAHVTAVVAAVAGREDCEIVACAEENPTARDAAAKNWNIKFTHDAITPIIEDVDCDAVVIADTYARRGPIAVAALKAGKHILSDKPICTTVRELDQIEKLARDNKRSVGCQLDLRDRGPFRTLRRLIRESAIGKVCTVNFMGQHPLMKGTRPGWYFEEGQHGGTINDIMIHAIDALPWMTGHKIGKTLAARTWGGELAGVGGFELCAQAMFTLENGAGVFGDVSYLAPDGCGYSAPQYWRFTIHGTDGVAETCYAAKDVMLATRADTAPRSIPAEADVNVGYLEDFLREIRGERPAPDGLTTARIIEVSRRSLELQAAATRGA